MGLFDSAPPPQVAQTFTRVKPKRGPWKFLGVHFHHPDDVGAFAEVVQQRIGAGVRAIWYPQGSADDYLAVSCAEAPVRNWCMRPQPGKQLDSGSPLFDCTADGRPKKCAAAWVKEWRGMPEFSHVSLLPHRTLNVYFRNEVDLAEFAVKVGQSVAERTKSIWYPAEGFVDCSRIAFVANPPRNPRYPVYIISKGRWESRLTSKALERIKVPYHIVIEPQEYDNYAAVIDPSKILVLPFSNLGQGSIPARNWVWEHSIRRGAKRHWILDDNIRDFTRYHHNLKVPVADGTIFYVAEDFTERYENVPISGLNYEFFIVRKEGGRPPYYLNTRVYSCILIQNDLPYRWRGRYNEDTDLSLRVLKDGYCTILFNAFLADKIATLTMKGGNTDELYKGDGRLKMAMSLKEQHPDLVTVIMRWGRAQHHVNYNLFKKNKLRLRPGVVIPDQPNNYGMEFVVKGDGYVVATRSEIGRYCF